LKLKFIKIAISTPRRAARDPERRMNIKNNMINTISIKYFLEVIRNKEKPYTIIIANSFGLKNAP
jgi:hypothetical protein